MTTAAVPEDASVQDCAPMDDVDQLSAELLRHLRLSHLFKAQLSSTVQLGTDLACAQLLTHLVKGGPQRQGDLAEASLLDPSTTSRRVGQLVQLGLAERRADPADGRAVQLVATPAGEDVVQRLRQVRADLFHRMLAGWSDADLTTLLGLLRRLNDDFEAHRPRPAGPAAAPRLPG